MRLTGGCQCGAVRYEITERPDHASLCHCRMCQKATGGAYLASATIKPGSLRWTRGRPASFQSSSVAVREFCAECGTPLAFRDLSGQGHAIALGTFDDPEAVLPDRIIGVEAERSWWRGEGLSAGISTEQDLPGVAQTLRSFQHPDHDTTDWRPAAP